MGESTEFLHVGAMTLPWRKKNASDGCTEMSLDLWSRQVTALTGPSGVGKTTVVRVLGGELALRAREVRLFGADVTRMPPRRSADLLRREVGTITQESALVESLDALSNVALPLRLRGRDDWRTRSEAAMETLGVGHLARRRPADASGGERQRIAVARMLAWRPRIVLADEPTSALDQHSATAVACALRSLSDEGSAVLVVTHDPGLAASCDRRVAMRWPPSSSQDDSPARQTTADARR